VYNDNANIFKTVNNEQNQKIMLIEYFQANIDYPLAREVTYMIFPLCLHGPMGQKNGPSNKEGVILGAFISSVLPLANTISCVNDKWNVYLEEAVGMQTGARLRSLFVTILAFGIPYESCMLWDKYKEHICDDCKATLQHRDIVEPSIEQIESWALHYLWDALAKFSKIVEDFGLPVPSVPFDRLETNHLLEVERLQCLGLANRGGYGH
jgi:hypothetical protein